MSFRGVFIAVILSTAMVTGAFLINARRPRSEVTRSSPALVRATGKCAECHRHETSAVVYEYEMSRHSTAGVTCLDCHQPVKSQEPVSHKGFDIAAKVTAASCNSCHQEQYEQFLRSRHAAPAWAAVAGKADFSAEQIAFAEQHHHGAVDRPAHELTQLEGPAAMNKGCFQCHNVGRPNPDGSIGTCTSCHARHESSIALARMPETCGQCHMGPDHAQLEIYHESKHGVLFNAQKGRMNLSASPKRLTAADMPVPTCATCHMSGLEGLTSTHDTSERLSYFLFAAVSDRRPDSRHKKTNMQQVCLKCHTNSRILQFYGEAESVVRSTNKLIREGDQLVAGLRQEKLLTPEPFDEPIEFLYFELWHHAGRTAKHGAFMGGADFVQWHGYYEVISRLSQLKASAAELRRRRPPAPSEPVSSPPAPKS